MLRANHVEREGQRTNLTVSLSTVFPSAFLAWFWVILTVFWCWELNSVLAHFFLPFLADAWKSYWPQEPPVSVFTWQEGLLLQAAVIHRNCEDASLRFAGASKGYSRVLAPTQP